LESSQDEDENSEEEEALLVQKAFAEKDRGNEFFKVASASKSIKIKVGLLFTYIF